MTPTEWLLKCWGRPLLQMFSLHSLSQMKVSAEEVMWCKSFLRWWMDLSSAPGSTTFISTTGSNSLSKLPWNLKWRPSQITAGHSKPSRPLCSSQHMARFLSYSNMVTAPDVTPGLFCIQLDYNYSTYYAICWNCDGCTTVIDSQVNWYIFRIRI